jgi:hypothetical protein
MKIKFTLLICLLLPIASLHAQKGLKGKWEGTITFGGHEKKEGYKFELFIESNGKTVKGQTYIHLSDTEVVIRKFQGRIFSDRSMSFKEEPDPYASKDPNLSQDNKLRKYQFKYTRSIFESTMEGYWQEIIKDPFEKSRTRGRIYMQKASNSKA